MAWKLIDVDCEGFEARFVFYDLFDGGRVDLINAVGVWGDVYHRKLTSFKSQYGCCPPENSLSANGAKVAAVEAVKGGEI